MERTDSILDMNRIKIILIVLLSPLLAMAQTVQFKQLNTNQFVTNSSAVALKDGVCLTNAGNNGTMRFTNVSTTASCSITPGTVGSMTLEGNGTSLSLNQVAGTPTLQVGGDVTSSSGHSFNGNGSGLTNIPASGVSNFNAAVQAAQTNAAAGTNYYGPFTNTAFYSTSDSGTNVSLIRNSSSAVFERASGSNNCPASFNLVYNDTPQVAASDDHVFEWGYNASPGGGKMISTECEWGWAFENNYFGNSEAHMRYYGIDGTETRPFSWLLNRTNNALAQLLIQAHSIKGFINRTNNASQTFDFSTNGILFWYPETINNSTGITISAISGGGPRMTLTPSNNVSTTIFVAGSNGDTISQATSNSLCEVVQGSNIITAVNGTLVRLQSDVACSNLVPTFVSGNLTGSSGFTNSGINASIGSGSIITKTAASGLTAAGASVLISPSFNTSGNNNAIFIGASGAGSANFQQLCRIQYDDGFTGKSAIALNVVNNCTTATTPSLTAAQFVCGVAGNAVAGGGTGMGVGNIGYGGGFKQSYGSVGIATTSTANSGNFGVVGFALNGTTNIAGYFSRTAVPVNVQGIDSTVQIENGTQTTPPLTISSNTVVVAQISAAGALITTNSVGTYLGNKAAPSSDTVGASPTSITNSTSVNVQYFVDANGATTALAVNGTTVFASVVGGSHTVILQPGEWLTVTYSIATPVVNHKSF